MSVSDDSESPYASAALQEASELLGFLEQSIQSNRRMQSVNNLKQIGVAADNLKQVEQKLGSYAGSGLGDFSKNRADVLKRVSEAERMAQQENQKTNEYFAKALQAKPGNSLIQSEGLADGEALAEEQRRSLTTSNNVADGLAILQDNSSSMSEFNFQLQSKEREISAESKSSKSESGQKTANPSNETRQQLRSSNSVNLDDLNSVVTNNAATRSGINISGAQGIQPGQQGIPQVGLGVGNQTITSNGSVLMGEGTFNANSGMGINSGLWNAQNPSGNPQAPLIPGLDNSIQFRGGIGFGGQQGQGQGQGGFGGGQFGWGQGGFWRRTVRWWTGWFQWRSVRWRARRLRWWPIRWGCRSTARSIIYWPVRRACARGMNRGPQAGAPEKPQATGMGRTFRPQMMSLATEMKKITSDDSPLQMRLPSIAQDERGLQRGEGRGDAQNSQIAGPAWRQMGGLSLNIELHYIRDASWSSQRWAAIQNLPSPSDRKSPCDGESALLWSAIWIVFGIAILGTLRSPSAVSRLTNQLPWAAAILGVLGFCALPGSLSVCSFVVFVVGAFFIAFRNRPSVAAA